MFGFVKKRRKTELITSILGEKTHVKGTLNSEASLCIEGQFEGDIYSQGDVYIGQKSSVKANIKATRVIVSGEVIGTIDVKKKVEITKTGKVYGHIYATQLLVEEGGIYKGQVNMDVPSSRHIFEGDFLDPARIA